jgi:hypothetical protein
VQAKREVDANAKSTVRRGDENELYREAGELIVVVVVVVISVNTSGAVVVLVSVFSSCQKLLLIFENFQRLEPISIQKRRTS